MPDFGAGPPPLLADAMLGKLARWLRLLGYDTAYLRDTDDLTVLRQARAEERLVLTRDTGLAGRRAVRALLIESQSLEAQIEQVVGMLGPPAAGEPPRCPVCNTPLETLAREAAQGRVPPYVWRTHETFTACPQCGRTYWEGTHWRAIRQRVKAAGVVESPSQWVE